MMPPISVQENLFREIRKTTPGQDSLAEKIGELLHISADSAYRRLRNETPLLLQEAVLIASAFGISLDNLIQQKSASVKFHTVTLENEGYDFRQYLRDVITQLERLVKAGNPELIYLSKDIPFFHNFHFRALFGFHYFFWMKSIQQHPDFAALKYSDSSLPPDIEAEGKRLISLYNSIPSIEIWNAESANSLIAQIEYYEEAQYFADPAEAQKVRSALSQTLLHVKEQAETGFKFTVEDGSSCKKAPLQLFQNRINLADNTVLAKSKEAKHVFINYDMLNYLFTTDAEFCDRMENRMKTLIKRSTILSRVSEKQRNIFFLGMIRGLED